MGQTAWLYTSVRGTVMPRSPRWGVRYRRASFVRSSTLSSTTRSTNAHLRTQHLLSSQRAHCGGIKPPPVSNTINKTSARISTSSGSTSKFEIGIISSLGSHFNQGWQARNPASRLLQSTFTARKPGIGVITHSTNAPILLSRSPAGVVVRRR